MRACRAALAAGVACLVVGGCAVGPDFRTPAPPRLERYDEASSATRLDPTGSIQAIEAGRPVDPAWWRQFGSADLDALVAEGLKNSPTLEAARQALIQSQDQARAGAGVFLPGLDASFSADRERTTPLRFGAAGGPASIFSLYTLAGAVTYPVDLFGGERRQVEALRAGAEEKRYAVGAAYLTLTGSLADAAIARAGYADAVDILTDIVALDAAQQQIQLAAYNAGHSPWSSVLLALQQLAADRASLAGAGQRAAASATLIKTLLGREAGEARPPAPNLAGLGVPAATPVSLPSQLVRQRPDILQAEAALHQASAQVGVATAALFPSITLTGDYGAASTALSRLGTPAGQFWSLGGGLAAPIFHGGALRYNRRAAEAAYRQAQADYRQTVLAALEQVSDSLKALDADAQAVAADREAFDAAAANASLVQANRQAGLVAESEAMAARIAADRARLVLDAAKTQRLQDTVALALASGGGWSPERLSGAPAGAAAFR